MDSTTISKDELIHLHRKEKKELQAKIQGMKHGVPKGDKKKKKDISAEISKLESELAEKQKKELQEFENKLEDLVLDEPLEENCAAEEVKAAPKLSKAQKRREKKANLERERDQRIAEQEKESEHGIRQSEMRRFKEILGPRQLDIFEVPSDGNCMYKAIEHQLSLKNIQISVPELRKKTADYMRSHSQDFLPFLTSGSGTGDSMSSEEFEKYCDKIASTAEWGGHLELQALSHALQTSIEVVQANGPSILLGENYKDESLLILSYHRHILGLGEHYNSVVPKTEEQESAADDKS